MRNTTKRYNRPFRYALSMFGLSVLGYMYASYYLTFYVEKIGLTMGIMATANLLFAIWDAFNDPISGYLSDRTRTKMGRRKPWLLIAVPIFMCASVLFFSPPEALGKGIGMTIYFTFFLMLTETANTISSVNYHSLLPELFRDTGERNSANALRQAFQLIGMIIGVSLVPTLADMLGYQLTAILLAVIGGGLTLYSVLGTKERAEFSEMPQPGLWTSLRAIASDRNFWCVSISHFFYQATSGLLLAGFPFYITYALGLEGGLYTTILTGCVFVTAIPAMILWHRLINKLGALRAWRMALLWLGLSIIPMFFAQGIVLASVAGAFVGIGIAGVTANLDMINSELIESDAAKYGVRREATYFAGISFITRLSSLTRSGVFLLLAVMFSFFSVSEQPGPNPGMASRFLVVIFPVALMACSFLFATLVRFNKAEAQASQES